MTRYKLPKVIKTDALHSKKCRSLSRENKADNKVSVSVSRELFRISRWLDLAEEELEGMNAGKEGRPYKYCNSMIVWIMLIMGYNKEMTLRKADGMIKGMLEERGLNGPDSSTICRRVRNIAENYFQESRDDRFICCYVKPKSNNNKIRAAIDSTGLNLSKTTMWRENKWGTGPKRRGWLKLHSLVDIDTGEILAYILTDDKVGDNSAFGHLVNLAVSGGYSLKVIFADAAYEDRKNWMLLDELKIKFVVKFKSSTSLHSRGSLARGRAAEGWITESYEDWKKITNYGLRWKVESAFSDFKRLTAETVSAVTTLGMAAQILSKVFAYNMHKRIRANMIGITRNEVYVADY